jgi:YesN/AraC family two-component response regulator
MDEYLSKPIDRDRLEAVLENCLRTASTERAAARA